MADVLLSTKITIPPVRTDLVQRAQLTRLLDSGRERRLMLLSAPAGFGKTTLLAAWAAGLESGVGWLTLDDGDNDPAIFLNYLHAALAQAGLTAPPPDPAFLTVQPSGRDYLTALANRAAEFGRPIVLVLDDYHAITQQPVHDILTYLLDRFPPNLHVVIASRADPPLPVARLRARGEVQEIRLAELRFTAEEAAAFLNGSMRLNLAPAEINALDSRTEGWVAGLQMAAVSLRAQPDRARFIEDFTGSNRYIMDYLMEEVLQQRSPAEQAFMLRTAVLEKMSGPLCEALVPELAPGQGQELLDHLERSNLFVVPLDDRRAWYRYHRLFADLLTRQLLQWRPGEIETLHRQASAWYHAHNQPRDAIYHALQAQDYGLAAGLMEPEAETLLMHSQLSTLMRWVDALPPEERHAHPLLLLYHAWAQAFSAHPVREVTAYLAEIEALGGLSPARIDPLRAYLLALQGETGQAVEVANRAAAELTEGDRFLYAVANWLRGLGLVYSGDLQAAMQALEQVVQLGLRSGNVAVTVMTLCSLGDQITSQGYFDLAEKTYQKALSLAYDAQGARLPVAGMVIMRLAEILRERNRLAEAEAMLLEGMDQIAGWNEMMAVNAHISWAIIRQERGDARGADEAIAEAARLARHYDITEMDDQTVEQYRLFVHLLRRDLAFARRWLENRPNPTDFGERPNGWRIDERERIMQARALTATGRPAEAAAILRPIRAGVEQAARRRRLTEVSALLALAESAQGQLAEALQTLRPVLSLAREHGYLQTLIDEGEPLRALLEEAARQGESAADARALLAAFPPAPPAAETDFEPFSARELEVMRLIAGGYSNAEIAARLFITERTVKFHTGNILAKLGVKNRTQAVLRAREMGLIAA